MTRDDVVIGRDAERAEIAAFIDHIADGPRVLLVTGEAGVGKTTLWEGAVGSARTAATVVTCRPVQTEARMAFAGLRDLLGGALPGARSGLPAPQRRALEAALLLEDGPRVDHQAVGAGTLSVLRALSAQAPVLVAVDDVQWLDRPSARALAFAVRRLESEPVRLLVSLRSGPREPAAAPELAQILERADTGRLRLGPLSVGAVERLLAVALGMTLPRTAMLRLHERAGGNPFFALEMGRALAEAGALPGPGQPLPVPDDLHVLLVDRVRRLPAAAREVLLLASLLSQPTEDALELAVGATGEQRRPGVRDHRVAPAPGVAVRVASTSETSRLGGLNGEDFTVRPATDAVETVEWVDRILKEERGIVISSPPLEASEFEADNMLMAYVFYESGLAINVM